MSLRQMTRREAEEVSSQRSYIQSSALEGRAKPLQIRPDG